MTGARVHVASYVRRAVALKRRLIVILEKFQVTSSAAVSEAEFPAFFAAALKTSSVAFPGVSSAGKVKGVT